MKEASDISEQLKIVSPGTSWGRGGGRAPSFADPLRRVSPCVPPIGPIRSNAHYPAHLASPNLTSSLTLFFPASTRPDAFGAHERQPCPHLSDGTVIRRPAWAAWTSPPPEQGPFPCTRRNSLHASRGPSGFMTSRAPHLWAPVPMQTHRRCPWKSPGSGTGADSPTAPVQPECPEKLATALLAPCPGPAPSPQGPMSLPCRDCVPSWCHHPHPEGVIPRVSG